MKKIVIIGYVIILIIGIYERNSILGWLQSQDRPFLPLMLVVSALLATIPFVPFTIFAGIMGLKYGVFLGFIISWFGGISASLIYFLLGKYLISHVFKEKINKYKGLKLFQEMFERNSFLAIMMGRLIYIIPPPLISSYSAMTSVSIHLFLLASAIGTFPSMLMLSFGGANIFSNLPLFIYGLLLYFLFMLVVIMSYRIWNKRKVTYS